MTETFTLWQLALFAAACIALTIGLGAAIAAAARNAGEDGVDEDAYGDWPRDGRR